MKILYVMLMLLVNIGAAAAVAENDTDQKKQENFLSHKQESLKQLDEKIVMLQKARECIHTANDQAALKKCQEDQEAAMKKMHQERRKMEITRIEEQQQKLEERKRKLQEVEAPKEKK